MTTSRATLAFACGSKSITSTFFSRRTKAPARLITVVVFPTPPLLFATLMIRGRVGAGFVIPFPFCLSRSRGHYLLYNRSRQEKLQRFCIGNLYTSMQWSICAIILCQYYTTRFAAFSLPEMPPVVPG